MSAKKPPDFTKDEIILITTTLRERDGHAVEVQLADKEKARRQAKESC